MSNIIRVPQKNESESLENKLLRFDKSSVFVYIDLETFNLCLNFAKNRPWQVSMIKVRDEKIIGEFDLFPDWSDTGLAISDEAAQVTGYYDKPIQRYGNIPMSDVYNTKKRPQKECFEILSRELNNADYIVGHNIINFDIPLIFEYYKLNGFVPYGIVNKFIDTLSLSKGVKTSNTLKMEDNLFSYQYKMSNARIRGTSLSAMGKLLEIEHDYSLLHDAMVDLSLNKKVFEKLKWKVEI